MSGYNMNCSQESAQYLLYILKPQYDTRRILDAWWIHGRIISYNTILRIDVNKE